MFEQRIFVDLDGVMANFDKRALEILGKPFIRHDNSIWDTLEKYQDFFQGLEPMPDAFTLWREIEKFKPIILTAIPRVKRFPMAEIHKKEWVERHLGKHIEFRTGPYAREKQFHCVGKDILIDDNAINIAQWSNKGGVGIYHVDAITSLKCLKEVGILNGKSSLPVTP